jgi:hypothetical protein
MQKWRQLPGRVVVVAGVLLGVLWARGVVARLAAQVVSEQENAGTGVDLGQSSANYSLDSIMDVVGGETTSANYEVLHGYWLQEEETGVVVSKIIAVPEKRTPPLGNNATIISRLEWRLPGDDKDGAPVVATGSTVVRPLVTNEQGIYDASEVGKVKLVLPTLAPGVYDIYVKGSSHLRKKVPAVTLTRGENELQLTALESASPPAMSAADYYLLAGDVNVVVDPDGSCGGVMGSCHQVLGGYSGDEVGDDKINSIDLGILVTKLFYTEAKDGAVNLLKEDLNRDGKVNSLDLGIAVNNILKSGGE